MIHRRPIPRSEKKLRHAVKHLRRYESTPKRGAVFYNTDDEAISLLEDLLFCLQTEREVSKYALRKARRGAWRLKPEYRES
jgi:hypothetical protein